MLQRTTRPICLILTAAALFAQSDPSSPQVTKSAGDRWPGFRGVGTSHTAAVDLPTTWGQEQNVAWTVTLPGHGQSSPVVFGDRVFVTSIEGPNKERCQVACYRLEDGYLLWSRGFSAGTEIKNSKMTSRGAPTPVVDDARVYAFFESGDLFAFDHDGETAWTRSFVEAMGGGYKGGHGFGSSLVAVDGGVVLSLDHNGPSFVTSINGADGSVRWSTPRTSRVSWSTPAASPQHGEVIVSSNGSVDGYALSDGAQRWTVGDISGNTVPSPMVAGDWILVGASKGANLALRRDGGDVTLAWEASSARPSSFASPVVFGGDVLIVNKAGVLYCVNLADGEMRYKQRLGESCWASPIVAGELVYMFGKSGNTAVIRPGAEGAEVVAENELPTEGTVYGVAVVDRTFLVREGERLICIRAPAAADEAPSDEAAADDAASGGGD